MMRTRSFLILFLIIPFVSFSQEYQNILWEKNRKRIEISDELKGFSSVYLKDFQLSEYVAEEDNFYIYNTVHKIIRVNNDEGIETFNRIYVPLYNAVELVEIKARSINPQGEIQDLSGDKIKEINDEETGNAFKIFAIEGLQAGSEVEYLYTAKQGQRYFGSKTVQERIPILNSEFNLICPEFLKFSFKGYNGYPNVSEEVRQNKRFYKGSVDFVSELEEEEYSAYNANRMRVEYKLAFNFEQGSGEILTWDDAAQRIYQVVYGGISDLDQQAIERFLELINLEDSDPENKIRAVENYIKTHISVQEGALSDIDELAMIISRNYTNTTGMVRLFAAIFKELEIDAEIVLTTGRDKTGFDPDFANWNNLTDYLFYFPSYEKFLTPDVAEYRYGMVPFYLTDNKGLFIRTFSLGNLESTEGRIDYIPTLSAEESFDKMEIDIAFDSKMSAMNIDFTRTLSGYNALFIQPYYPYIPEEDSKRILEELIRGVAEDATFEEVGAKNGEENVSPLTDPFIINASFKSSTVVEKAGPNLLFKIGEVIGQQVEMYQEKERVMPMENDYLRKYIRYINFTIPEGYTVRNPDDINMSVLHEKNGRNIFGFTSSYTIEGDVLKLVCEEYYNDLRCPVEEFEEFRKVINAAADFNKIVLVLEKN